MKKLIPIILVGILLSTAFGAVAIPSDEKSQDGSKATHTVIGEYGTATWCGYCKYAHGALKALYKGDWHDFYYVSLVDDVKTHAAARVTQLGLTGFPTVFWDGKYRTNVGAGSIPSAMVAYNSSIIASGARTVPNIDLTISATWLGSATVSITVTVTNNGASAYSGYLRCYVTEIASSMGWYDTGGQLYTFPFLDYAFDQSISASAGGTWSNTVSWAGAAHNDGHGHDFSGITQDNTFIVAAVFATSGGYVDEAAGYRVGNNRAPGTPNTPSPINGATNVPVALQLNWQCTDPDWFDTLYYDVYFEKDDATPDILVSDDQTATYYIPGTLDMESDYYWQIVVHDPLGLTATSPVWHFTTRGNQPPNTPSNPNPANGSINIPTNKVLSWTGGDPDSDPVKYDVYFGLTNPPSKVTSNQSGTSYTPATMNGNTTYYWKIIAWDNFGASTIGPIWQFTTSAAVNNPPYNPVITGPPKGSPGVDYTYTFTATDPDANQISYYVDWGDNTSTGWLGPYASGYLLTANHQWAEKGTYIVKAKVKDEHGLESDWASLSVTMPTKFDITQYPFLHWLFEQFPHAFPLLRNLFLGA
ncbi:MAG TPA: thioredoxin family protein [Candidatus Thermoplasmatota archaeon]|nr:thioredoxin family protein [Candidatus Thermoplasmatota archaeon]